MTKKRKKKAQIEIKSPKTVRIPNWLPAVIIAGFIIIIALMRLATYNEPFERDIASHAVIAHELLEGRNLYSDLWDSKPPAIFVTYAFGQLIAGYGPGQVYFLGVLAAAVTLIGLYKVGKKHGGAVAGIFAAGFWTLLASNLWLWANQPNIEVFINCLIVWAFLLMLNADPVKLEPLRWIGIGVLFAVGTLYKPVAIAFAFFLALAWICINLKKNKAVIFPFCHIAIVIGVGTILWGLTLVYFAATDRLQCFYDTIVTYGQYYTKSRGGGIFKNIAEAATAKRLFARCMKDTVPLAILAGMGLICGIAKGTRRQWILALAFMVAAFFAVALPGRFYAHYYQLWLCPIIIASAWAVTPGKQAGLKFIKPTAGVIAFVIVVFLVAPQYKLSGDQWTANKYGSQFVLSKKLGEEINGLLKNDESLYVWGINPELYFWTKKSPPTGLIWATDTIDGPLAEEYTKRALNDLINANPDLLVVNRLHIKTPPGHPIIVWAQKNYIPISKNPNRGLLYGKAYLFGLYVNRTSDLAKRLNLVKP